LVRNKVYWQSVSVLGRGKKKSFAAGWHWFIKIHTKSIPLTRKLWKSLEYWKDIVGSCQKRKKGWKWRVGDQKSKHVPSKYIMQNQLVVLELLIAIINMVSCNSKRLPLLVDRHGSTTCSWCSVLSNLLVNPWASKCASYWEFSFLG